MENRAVNQVPTETKKQSTKQKGYSIIELSIALAIISIILVTSLAGVQRVLRSNNVNNDLRNINLAVASLTALSATQTSTSGVTMANLVGLKVFDGFAVDTVNSRVTNAFGGQITVASNTNAIDGYPANSGFLIYSNNIPSEACPDYINGIATLSPNISTTNANNPLVAGAVYSGANSTSVKSGGGAYTLATLATACAVTAANPKITIAAFVGKT
jgi:prepilin-type N-terminal cleavage/methylation domain-containing protein